jgi:hypothetical protein
MVNMSPPRPSFLRGITVLGLSAALTVTMAFAPSAHADTGGPLPQGYNSDVPAAPQQPAPPPPQADRGAPPMQQVQDPADPAAADDDGYADDDPRALTDFREPLEPYGDWIQDPNYGTIWVPDATQVGPDFAPYQTAGQWGVNDGGDWMWQSDYSWGYVPFHYGRWVWAGSSWGWVPGRRYAPAWVSWRVGEGGYVGWAPMPPTYRWGPHGAARLGVVPMAAFCFVPVNLAFARGVSSYVVRDRASIGAIAAGTHPYRAAQPSVGGRSGEPLRMSPTLSQAHIPSSAAPARPMAADPQAMAYSSRSAMRAAQAGNVGRVGGYGGTYRIHGNGGGAVSSYPRSMRYASPGLRTPGTGSSIHRSSSPRAFPSGPHFSAPASTYHPPQAQPAAHPARSSGRSGGRRR